MADSKDHGVATQTSGYHSGSAKNIDEKHRAGKRADVDLPTYDDAERHGSEAVNISGVHDNTHRKLKARHIQLIGSVYNHFIPFSQQNDSVSSQSIASEAPSAQHSTSRSAAVSSMAARRVSSSLSPCGARSF
jgi:hypothetical protein